MAWMRAKKNLKMNLNKPNKNKALVEELLSVDQHLEIKTKLQEQD
jgi:hypothetical protein